MKFEKNVFLKHKNGIDAFINVNIVRFDNGKSAVIQANWMVQGLFGYWFTRAFDQRILIKSDQYDNWLPYEPKGECL